MSDTLFVGTRKGLFVLRRAAGGGWELDAVEFLGSPVTAVLRDARDGSAFVALNLGHFGAKVHRSIAGGAWEECATPEYPDRPAELPADDALPGSKAPWSTIQVWSLETGGPDEDGVLWAGTIPGGLFRSPDRGSSWELQRSLWDRPERLDWFGGGYDHAGIHSVCVDPRASASVTLGVSCGGVWATADGGASWECLGKGLRAEYMPPEQQERLEIQDPHRLVRCAGAPDHLWIQHHNGIFRSRDGGRNWSEIPSAGPSTFGFAVAVHPADPDTAWFVPAVKDECRVPVDGRFALTRTRDGGDSFDLLTEGLSVAPAYDLVYRHGLDVDAQGERLAVGSTSGGLWTSDDGGDHWRALPARLPPVYCVRFV